MMVDVLMRSSGRRVNTSTLKLELEDQNTTTHATVYEQATHPRAQLEPCAAGLADVTAQTLVFVQLELKTNTNWRGVFMR